MVTFRNCSFFIVKNLVYGNKFSFLTFYRRKDARKHVLKGFLYDKTKCIPKTRDSLVILAKGIKMKIGHVIPSTEYRMILS